MTGMGVSSQMQDGVNGILLSPGKGGPAEEEADVNFGNAVATLLGDPQLRARLGTAASRTARERAHPHVVQQRMAEAFHHAREHAGASGLRPAMNRPKVMQWLTTMQHARPWMAVNGGLYLIGHLRPAKPVERPRIHPQFSK